MIFGSARAAAGLRLADGIGLLSPLLPELDEMRGVEQPKQHHWDVFNHGIEAVAAMDVILASGEPADPLGGQLWRELWGRLSWWGSARERWAEETSPGVPRFAVLKLCALLHDIGKPRTRTVEAGGRIRFFGHSEAGADIAAAVLRRLHCPSAVVSDVTSMINAHLRPLQIAQFGPPSRRAVYRFFRDTGAAGPDTLFLSLADHLATAGPRVTAAGWQRHVAVVDYLLRMSVEQRTVDRAPALLTGDDIMRDLGLEPGRRVGELLELVREAHSVGEISTRDEALLLARRHLERKETRS
jgi:putative nucleotidyltransferase with HDIG domain